MNAFRLLSVPRVCYDGLVAQALAEQPRECCGLLAGVIEGDVGRVTKAYPLVNALGSAVEYESDPRSMLDAMRDLMTNRLDVLAVYHSHPTSPPVPSRKDLERNYSEDVVNLIVSLVPSPPLMRGWWLTATEYREAEWEVV